MLTSKYFDTGLFRCDYKGQTTLGETRMQARLMMELVFFGCDANRVLH